MALVYWFVVAYGAAGAIAFVFMLRSCIRGGRVSLVKGPRRDF